MPEKSNGILMIDGFNWSSLKTPDRATGAQATIEKYNAHLRRWIEDHRGTVWATIGDCTIACGFPDIDEAVAAAISVQRRLFQFNLRENEPDRPLIVRIGVATGNLPDVPVEHRGEHSDPALDEAGHLQKDCPPGRIRISRGAFKLLRHGRNSFRPGRPAGPKSKSAESLVWNERSPTPLELEHTGHLALRQRRFYPLVAVARDDLLSEAYDHDFSEVPKILPDSIVILGETREELSVENPVHHPAPTSDAAGIIEILAALPQAPHVSAGIDEWVDTGDLATHTSIVVIGSPVVNIYAYAANTVTPAGFLSTRDGLLRIRVSTSDGEIYFPEKIEHSEFDRHYGLVLLTRNPMNPTHHLLWIAGISGIGTYLGSRFVRDLILNTKNTLSTLGGASHAVPNIAIVTPAKGGEWDADHYLDANWRVSEYEVAWAGRHAPRGA